MRVQIRIKGQIDEHWSSWFEDLAISRDDEHSETLLRGKVFDQAALYGLLAKLRDLGLSLLSVTVANAGGADNGATDRDALGKHALGDAETLDT